MGRSWSNFSSQNNGFGPILNESEESVQRDQDCRWEKLKLEKQVLAVVTDEVALGQLMTYPAL